MEQSRDKSQILAEAHDGAETHVTTPRSQEGQQGWKVELDPEGLEVT